MKSKISSMVSDRKKGLTIVEGWNNRGGLVIFSKLIIVEGSNKTCRLGKFPKINNRGVHDYSGP